MGYQLIKHHDAWTVTFMGKERHFFIESELVSWLSMGIHPDGAVEFNCDLSGGLETVRLRTTGEELTELEIPKSHSLYGDIKPTKPYVHKE